MGQTTETKMEEEKKKKKYLEAVSATVDLRVFSLMASMKVSSARACEGRGCKGRCGFVCQQQHERVSPRQMQTT